MDELFQKKCVPCEGGEPPMIEADEDLYLKRVPLWRLSREGVHSIARDFKFKNFKDAMCFVNAVADVAEAEGHHPDIVLYYNKLNLKLYTHVVGGLSLNDFIVAAKIDQLEATYV